jgi:hypothetical protein
MAETATNKRVGTKKLFDMIVIVFFWKLKISN